MYYANVHTYIKLSFSNMNDFEQCVHVQCVHWDRSDWDRLGLTQCVQNKFLGIVFELVLVEKK